MLSIGYAPRDGLLRMGADLPIIGAGDVVRPGCTLEEAEASGRRAGAGAEAEKGDADAPRSRRHRRWEPEATSACARTSGVTELETAWDEGWTNSEILKRYTTATMGPCQGALCGRHLAAFARQRGGSPAAGARTTARPPARTVKLEDLAGGINEVIEKRTALHDTHLAAGAVLDWSGSWKRPSRYGDVREEYRAVRERVSVMDVGTLGKFLVAGADAAALVDRVFPCRTDDLRPGRSRYVLALDEAGYVMDDGLLCAAARAGPATTARPSSRRGGADRMEAWLRNWADRWDLHVHLVNQTAMLGAINVAGPRARELLQRLSDDDLAADGARRIGGHREITVAGVPCRAIRSGLRRRGVVRAASPTLARRGAVGGADRRPARIWGSARTGSTRWTCSAWRRVTSTWARTRCPTTIPTKLGLGWCVAMDKPSFLGKAALERMAAVPAERKLVGLRFDGRAAARGPPVRRRAAIVGRVTSCARSEALEAWIGLGWIRAVEGDVPRAPPRGGPSTRHGRAHAVLRPSGGAAPCLSSHPRRRSRVRNGGGEPRAIDVAMAAPGPYRVAPDELMMVGAPGTVADGAAAALAAEPSSADPDALVVDTIRRMGGLVAPRRATRRAFAYLVAASNCRTRASCQGDVAHVPVRADRCPGPWCTSSSPRCGAPTCATACWSDARRPADP